MYLRFGDIPQNEKSKVWHIDECVGEEIGVSVYDAIISEDDMISIGIPFPVTGSTIDTFIGLVKYQNLPCFLVDGDFVGRGKDGEPLIKNVRIIKEIKSTGTQPDA